MDTDKSRAVAWTNYLPSRIVAVRLAPILLLLMVGSSSAVAPPSMTIDDYPQYASALDAAKQSQVRALARAICADLAANADVSVVVHGHADFDAKGAAFETQISQNRANTAAAELRRLLTEECTRAGVDPSRVNSLRIDTVAHGTSQALFRNPTPAQRLKNRRVEIATQVRSAPGPGPGPRPGPGPSPGPGPRPVAQLTPEQLESTLFRLDQENKLAITASPRGQVGGGVDALFAYAAQCATETKITIPDTFSCLAGEDVPGQKFTPTRTRRKGPCIAPNVLNGECDPGSRFQVLNKTQDAVVVAHCRKVGLHEPPNDQWNDIAIIQYNKANGAICFYQTLGTTDKGELPGTDIPSPGRSGSPPLLDDLLLRFAGQPWKDGQRRWFSPARTEEIGCTGCHDNGGLVRTPYIMGTKKMRELSDDGFLNNKAIELHYVGAAFSKNCSWSIDAAQDSSDQGLGNCNDCHRLAVSNHRRVIAGVNDPKEKQLGSAWAFAVKSTAAFQNNKLPHSATSPIWMRPPTRDKTGKVIGHFMYDPGAEKTAKRFQNCAKQFVKNNFDMSKPVSDCVFTPLGTPWPVPPTPPRQCRQ